MIILFLILELVKRPIFWLLYPLAYLLRDWCRTYKLRIDPFYKDRLYVAPQGLRWFFWLLLDDSIRMETGREYCETKRSSWVEWLPESGFKEFARSYYWSAWRNNGINLSWVLCFGQWTSELYHIGNEQTYYRILRYGKIALPQFQYVGSWKLQMGWLTNGKFECEVRKM